jgi:hypothetical protein
VQNLHPERYVSDDYAQGGPAVNKSCQVCPEGDADLMPISYLVDFVDNIKVINS